MQLEKYKDSVKKNEKVFYYIIGQISSNFSVPFLNTVGKKLPENYNKIIAIPLFSFYVESYLCSD